MLKGRLRPETAGGILEFGISDGASWDTSVDDCSSPLTGMKRRGRFLKKMIYFRMCMVFG